MQVQWALAVVLVLRLPCCFVCETCMEIYLLLLAEKN